MSTVALLDCFCLAHVIYSATDHLHVTQDALIKVVQTSLQSDRPDSVNLLISSSSHAHMIMTIMLYVCVEVVNNELSVCDYSYNINLYTYGRTKASHKN